MLNNFILAKIFRFEIQNYKVENCRNDPLVKLISLEFMLSKD